MTETEPLETPTAAYNRARALEMKRHTYRHAPRVGIIDPDKAPPPATHVVCGCGATLAMDEVTAHVETYAETVGTTARDDAVRALALQHLQEEQAKAAATRAKSTVMTTP